MLFVFVISETLGHWDFKVDWLEEQNKIDFLFPTVRAYFVLQSWS